MSYDKQKCNKYLYKLTKTNIESNKFNIYLMKLNKWYHQTGGHMVTNKNTYTYEKTGGCHYPLF